MPFESPVLSDPVRTILQKHADAVMPLTRSAIKTAHEDVQSICRIPAGKLFRGARQPEAALSGLLLRLNCWEESHHISQDVSSSEGSYWHGIAHRIEPDSWNAGYWFRRVGKHPVFPELYTQTQRILAEHGKNSSKISWQLKSSWDPFLFIEWCDEARTKPGTIYEQVALAIQQEEWQLLFGWCAALPT